MNIIRIALSLFVGLLIVVSVAGWIWAGGHQPPGQLLAARVVLGLGILAGIGGLAAIWRARPLDSARGRPE
jgi:hypothetical protein